MKYFITYALLSVGLTTLSGAQGYTNFVRQIQVNSGVEWDFSVASSGQRLSELAIDPGGARFELWTVEGSTLEDYFLDEQYVGVYVPLATLVVQSEDPYVTIPRTRADRPFTVTLKLEGLLSDPSAPDAARMINLRHHVQSYGEDGTGLGVDRSLASLDSEGYIDTNGDYSFSYPSHSIPGPDLSKVRGEERFTVWSLPDYQAPEAVLANGVIQVWPVADGAINGLADGDNLRFLAPDLTVTLNDLYPDSRTYAQVYKGTPALGTEGAVVPGSAVVVNDAVPQDRTLTLDGWDTVLDESGVWTMELLTETPFGVDRLDYVTFSINRDIEVNGTVTTVE